MFLCITQLHQPLHLFWLYLKPSLLLITDANVPHRAQYNKLKKRMDYKTKSDFGPQYIPVYNNHRFRKPMFIQTESTKILPPDLVLPHQFTNISKDIGGKNAVLPKFKPISDEQILKISEILNDVPFKMSTRVYDDEVQTKRPYSNENIVKSNRFRKGKDLKGIDNEILSSEESKETVAITTKEIERQDEKKCQQGGTCEFFFYCWMVGGLLEGSCGGLLKGCCHRVAKAGILGVQDSNSIDYSSETGLSYGPVINDQSKFFWLFD